MTESKRKEPVDDRLAGSTDHRTVDRGQSGDKTIVASGLLTTLEEATKILDESSFGRWWKFVVASVEPGSVVVHLPVRPEFYRPGGIVQGGCLMTLADVAFWLAAMTRIGVDPSAVTLEMKTNFLSSAASDLSCRAEVMKYGRRIVYGTATTFGATGTIFAHHTVTYLRS